MYIHQNSTFLPSEFQGASCGNDNIFNIESRVLDGAKIESNCIICIRGILGENSILTSFQVLRNDGTIVRHDGSCIDPCLQQKKIDFLKMVRIF